MRTVDEIELRAIVVCGQSDGLMKQQSQGKIKEMEDENEKSKMQDL